jgi:hypothetical protein
MGNHPLLDAAAVAIVHVTNRRAARLRWAFSDIGILYLFSVTGGILGIRLLTKKRPDQKQMRFPYYDNLSAAKKRIYRKSDAVESIPLENPQRIHPVTTKLKKSLEDNNRRDVAKHASEICRLVCEGLGIETLTVRIRSKRPSSSAEELQGLYERTEGETCVLTVWMKTAAKGHVVAFKSFIRTVLHELCHHIDYTYFDLDDSLHTDGFFKRESLLYKQVVPLELQRGKRRKRKASQKEIKRQKSKQAEQLELI